MWTQGYMGYLCITDDTNICYLVIAGVQPVTLPPPPPPPPPALGMESGPPSLHPPSVNGKGRSALLSSIQSFSKGRLKKAETNDRSNPHIWATLFMVLSSYRVQFILGPLRLPGSDLQKCFKTGGENNLQKYIFYSQIGCWSAPAKLKCGVFVLLYKDMTLETQQHFSCQVYKLDLHICGKLSHTLTHTHTIQQCSGPP